MVWFRDTKELYVVQAFETLFSRNNRLFYCYDDVICYDGKMKAVMVKSHFL